MNGLIMYNQQEDVYKYLQEGIIDKIIRHYKIIKKNFDDDDIYLKQNPENSDCDNICQIGIYSFDKNELVIYLDRINNSDNYKWNSLTELKDYINDKKNELYNKYKVEFNKSINNTFTNEEYENLYRVINRYNINNKDNLYIRLTPSQLEKNNLICRYLEIYDRNYYKDLLEHNKINEYLDGKYMPTYNVDYIYSESKYDAIENKKVNEIFNNVNVPSGLDNVDKKIEEL